MSDLKQQIIEESDQVISHPSVQKALAGTPLLSGGAAAFEFTQGWLAIISLLIGIVAGWLVIVYNKKRNILMDMEIEEKNLIIKKLKAEQANDR